MRLLLVAPPSVAWRGTGRRLLSGCMPELFRDLRIRAILASAELKGSRETALSGMQLHGFNASKVRESAEVSSFYRTVCS